MQADRSRRPERSEPAPWCYGRQPGRSANNHALPIVDASPAELVGAVAAGDHGALATLYDRHAPWLTLRLARRCADAGTVDEVVQDTFVAVWKDALRAFAMGQVMESNTARIRGLPGIPLPVQAADVASLRPVRCSPIQLVETKGVERRDAAPERPVLDELLLP